MVRPSKLLKQSVKVIGPVAEHDWLFAFTFPWTNNHGENIFKIAPGEFKQYPGCHYAPGYGKGIWVIPVEGLDWLRDTAAKLDLGYIENFQSNVPAYIVNPYAEIKFKDLHQYQTEGANKALQQGSLDRLRNGPRQNGNRRYRHFPNRGD
jgi:hypothetical protein